jgi:hypothetical protein
VTGADYQRAILLARIEAQRTILGLEVRLARRSFHPLGALLGLVGFDRGVAGTVAASVQSILARRDAGLAALVPLLVAALLPLADRLRRADAPAPDGAGSASPSAD